MNRKSIHTLPEPERSNLNAVIAKNGMKWTRVTIEISEHTLARAAGGLSIQRGTAAYIAQRLSEILKAEQVKGLSPT